MFSRTWHVLEHNVLELTNIAEHVQNQTKVQQGRLLHFMFQRSCPHLSATRRWKGKPRTNRKERGVGWEGCT